MLRVSWTAKKTNEWVLNKEAGVKRELLDTDKARKLAYYGHTMRKQGSCLEKEIMQGTMSRAHRRGRPHTARIDNINMWTGLSVEESIRMREDRDKTEKVRPWCGQPSDQERLNNRTQTHPFNGPLGLRGSAGTRKVKPIRILLKQETVSSSGIKSAPSFRQITMPAPHHSVFTGRMPFLLPNQLRQSTEGQMQQNRTVLQ